MEKTYTLDQLGENAKKFLKIGLLQDILIEQHGFSNKDFIGLKSLNVLTKRCNQYYGLNVTFDHLISVKRVDYINSSVVDLANISLETETFIEDTLSHVHC